MRWSGRSDLARLLRVVHRDLGFLVTGVCLVYALSGILLNHLDGKDPAYRTTTGVLHLEPGLSREELVARWTGSGEGPALKRVLPLDEGHERLLLDGGTGLYDAATGRVDYEHHERVAFVYWINKLHYGKVKGWGIVADLFAASLVFLALSGLLIVKGKRGVAGRGKWFLLAGLLVPVLYILLS
jgi:hypothetical protein